MTLPRPLIMLAHTISLVLLAKSSADGRITRGGKHAVRLGNFLRVFKAVEVQQERAVLRQKVGS